MGVGWAGRKFQRKATTDYSYNNFIVSLSLEKEILKQTSPFSSLASLFILTLLLSVTSAASNPDDSDPIYLYPTSPKLQSQVVLYDSSV